MGKNLTSPYQPAHVGAGYSVAATFLIWRKEIPGNSAPDTLEMWKFGDYKHYTSLDLLTALFEIPSSKGELDGSQVNANYKTQDLKK